MWVTYIKDLQVYNYNCSRKYILARRTFDFETVGWVSHAINTVVNAMKGYFKTVALHRSAHTLGKRKI